MRHLYTGKVRELYSDGDDLLLVASDRISVYDAVLPTPIPDKGALLTQLSVFWFNQLADIVGNHLISSSDVPAGFLGRAIRCRPLKMIPVECIARVIWPGLLSIRRRQHFRGAIATGLVEEAGFLRPFSHQRQGHDVVTTSS